MSKESLLPTSTIDRAWSAAWVSMVLGPLQSASTKHMHERYEALLTELPLGHWLRQYPEPFAKEVEGDVLPLALACGQEEWSGHPLRAFVNENGFVALQISHGLGDGRSNRRLAADLLASPGTPYSLSHLVPVSRIALGKAAFRLWATSPRRLFAAANSVMNRVPPRGSAEGPMCAKIVYFTLDPATVAELRLRKAGEQGHASLSTFLLESFLGALTEREITIERVAVAADIRRYMTEGHRFGGNLAPILQYPGRGGEPLAKSISRSILVGHPLAQYLVSSVRNIGVANLRSYSTPDAVSTLSWSDRGLVDEWDNLPWDSDSYTRIAFGPVRGSQIAVSLLRSESAIEVAVVFNGGEFHEAGVVGAVEATFRPLLLNHAK